MLELIQPHLVVPRSSCRQRQR